MDFTQRIIEIEENGFSIVKDLYTAQEIKALIQCVEAVNDADPAFRKSKDLFAIRQFLAVVPKVQQVLFNSTFKKVLSKVLGKEYFLVKSIYFDKPPASNWFVAWHQDLTISVNQRLDIPGFSHWTQKQGLIGTQPPIQILQDNFTLRIHLDDTTSENGALYVLPGSHLNGIVRPETIQDFQEKEAACTIEAGGIMIMKPLLMHRSSRTTNQQQRRVIHLEFSRSTLPEGLDWAEKSISSE